MLSIQLYILLFADNVALLAFNLFTIQLLFKAFSEYCNQKKFKISEMKTKLLVNDKGMKETGISKGSWVKFGEFDF